MGGFGSGDWSNVATRKVSIEQCRVLSIKKLRLAGLFNSVGNARSVAFNDGVGEYEIELERTACRLGGYRYWFVCPLVADGVFCGNRCAKLYLPPAGLGGIRLDFPSDEATIRASSGMPCPNTTGPVHLLLI